MTTNKLPRSQFQACRHMWAVVPCAKLWLVAVVPIQNCDQRPVKNISNIFVIKCQWQTLELSVKWVLWQTQLQSHAMSVKREIGIVIAWWYHRMETFSALLTLCVRNSPVNSEFNTPSRSLWGHRNDHERVNMCIKFENSLSQIGFCLHNKLPESQFLCLD